MRLPVRRLILCSSAGGKRQLHSAKLNDQRVCRLVEHRHKRKWTSRTRLQDQNRKLSRVAKAQQLCELGIHIIVSAFAGVSPEGLKRDPL